METKILNFAAPIELYKAIEEEAKKNERSVSAQIRFILSKYFEVVLNHENKN